MIKKMVYERRSKGRGRDELLVVGGGSGGNAEYVVDG